MKTNGLFAALCCAALLTGCTAAPKQDNPDGSADSTAETTAAVTEAPAETEPAPPAERSLVTLGDSIAFGYGMEDPDTQRYSAIVSAALSERDGISWHDYNYALSGDDSSDLLWRLQKGRAKFLPSSDKIIINIGSNNLLGVYEDYVRDRIDFDEDDLDIDSLTDEQIADMQKQVEDALSDEEAVRQEIETRLDENLTQLSSDLEEIYAWIRNVNEDADIYVLNIYNPYRDTEENVLPGLSDDPGTYAQTQIDRANQIIADFTDRHSDLIPVDIAAAFAASNPLPIAGKTEAELPAVTDSDSPYADMEYLDPHPDEAGQKLIADTILAKMDADS